MAHNAILRPKRLVLGLSASSKSLYNVLKCKTSEKKRFNDIALIISREIYVFVRSGFFSVFAKKSTLAKGPFSALVRHTDIVRYQFSILLLIFTTVCHKTMQNNCRNNTNSKKSHFSRSTLNTAVNRIPKVEFLLKQAKMYHLI